MLFRCRFLLSILGVQVGEKCLKLVNLVAKKCSKLVKVRYYLYNFDDEKTWSLIMERMKLAELEKWYRKSRRKPLVVWGARQVGKTYLVKELFAKRNFSDFLYIDLKKDDEACAFFSTTSDPEKYLRYIEARYGEKINSNVPLVFDEVQQCHQVLSSLKYFKQDYPELVVIATGSLVRLSIKHDESKGRKDDFLFPVGCIDSINVYPLTFEEYLLNANKEMLERIKKAYNDKKPLEEYEHQMALDYLYEYLAIGGMPEPLSVFLNEKSYVNARESIREIYDNYLADMDLYNVSKETISRTKNVFKNIYSELNKENKNFKIGAIEKGKSNRDYFNAYQWLELAKVIYRSKKKQGKVVSPLSEEDDGLFRFYLSDTGVFSYQSKTSQTDYFVKEKRNSLTGIFYENYVADEFVAKEIPLFYWVGKGGHEFEFIVENQSKIIPIDVKKTKGKMNSLDAFRSVNPKTTAIKISANHFGYDEERDILTVPLYEVFLLADDLACDRPLIR